MTLGGPYIKLENSNLAPQKAEQHKEFQLDTVSSPAVSLTRGDSKQSSKAPKRKDTEPYKEGPLFVTTVVVRSQQPTGDRPPNKVCYLFPLINKGR